MSQEVVYSTYGGTDVLEVVESDPPVPEPGQVRVRVKAAGIQPFDVKQRRGDTADWAPAKFPQVSGSEFAGVVDELGEGVTEPAVGAEVIGWPVGGAHTQYAVARADALVAKPPGMPWEEAGAIGASGQTAHTSLQALDVAAGETVLIHAAAGGVGTAAVQLAKAWGAEVVGTASERNHEYLRELGAVPVTYGAGLVERVREAAPDGVDAALDAVGTEDALRASIDLVGDLQRIGTIAGQEIAPDLGVRILGMKRSTERLAELVRLYAEGKLRVHLHAAFSLDDAAKAHREVETGHVRGKVVLVPSR
ncbi:NADP-dependent oxidoreductase [Actinobacteria bacterium YIM 96077]|uniref:NADP-dependent oxidoreductase n=1 Tax=Phytoactinopolyspora halophila TaxID=1981511 RepID=A0A329QVZ0_9ACTN|nr:NADP-dependent oxidoreductase [Phytoactinopolyspora halophila]AYY15619.1 NADP-dependent oxidoreductase [Actinobacteria bacterium YIM 96077]RAW14888.1 NADP-dependent oxidoreductase [Phytoactinopolyspora halophila]